MSDAVDARETQPQNVETAEEWKALDGDEQDAVLDEGLARMKGDKGSGQFRHFSKGEQRDTVDSVTRGEPERKPMSETERAMAEALDDTFTAEVFQGLDDVPTVPFECRVLSGSEIDQMREALGMLEAAGAAEVETEEDVENLDVDGDHFDSIDELDAWLTEFLASVTTDPAFDEQRWRTGERLRAGTREQLLIEVYIHHEEENERAQKFRQQSRR